ncbi:MAG: STAS domain-containing protein [Chloroflexota bacterium]|nr:STAS domain-containing protein [Chloroflexota bacterium]
MDINVNTVQGVTVAELAGDIDAKSVLKVQEQLVPLVQPERRILLDMSGVDYLSSAGLRMLLSLYRQVASHNGRIALVGVSEEIRDTMSVTGFLRFFTLYESVGAGLAAMT